MEERKLYPLNGSQEHVYMLAEMMQSYDVLHIVAHLEFRNDVDEELMRRAIYESIKRLPFCNVRITRDADGRAWQYMSHEPPAPVDTVCFTAEDEKRQNEIFHDWCNEFFPTIEDVPLTRFRLIRYPDGHLGLIFVIQHMIMDGYVGVWTLQYVAETYIALLDGTELPEPSPEPWEVLEADAAFAGSPRWQKQRDRYVEKYFSTEPQFTSVNGLGAPEFVEGKRYGRRQDITQLGGKIIQHSLDTGLVQRVADTAERLHVSPQILYMLALRSYLGHVSGTDDVSIDGMLAARSTLVEKTCGMSLANGHCVRTIIPESTRFSDAVGAVFTAQSDAMRLRKVENLEVHRQIFERFNTPDDCFYHSTWLTYFPPVHLPEDKLDLDGRFYISLCPTPLYVLVLPDSTRGTLGVTYLYGDGYVQPESIEKLHSFLVKFLSKAVEAPDRSLKELIDESL